MKLREKLQKVGEQTVNMLFNKVLGENERCLFFLLQQRKFLAKWILFVFVSLTQILRLRGIMNPLSYCDWLFSLSTVGSRFIYVVSCGKICFIFMAEYYSSIYIYMFSLFINHWGLFRLFYLNF